MADGPNRMRWWRWVAVGACAWAGILAARGEVAVVEGSPYRAIVERNVFGLKDPPPPPATVPVAPTNPVPVKSAVQLAGISVGSEGKYALLVLPVAPPGRTNRAVLRLSADPGDEQEGIRVLEINPRQGTVRLINAGVEETLDIRDDAPPLVAVPAAPGAARGGGIAGGRPGVGVPARGRPGTAVPTTTTRGGIPVPTSPGVSRVSRTPTSVGGVAAGSRTAVTGQTTATGLRTIPARQIRTLPAEPVPQIPAQEQHQIMLEQESAAAAQGIPFPPTPPLVR